MANELYANLAELTKEEEALSGKVDKLLSNASNFSRNLQKLDVLLAQSQSLQISSSYLLSSLEVSATTAERISLNVRNLDSEQSRVKETLKYVEEVKELKACVIGIHQSMEAQDWEVAAEFIHRASLVPQQIAKGQFSAMMVPSSETPLNPAETIRDASEQLYVLFQREFKKAADARSTQQITRFFKLFPQIDKADEGLDLYASFVSSIIAERSDQALNTASTSSILYASLVTSLFEHIAKLITNHSPLIMRFYGKNIDRVLENVQIECDKQGILILTTLMEDRQITKKISEIKSYSFSYLVQRLLPSSRDVSQAPAEREVDSRALDALLSEISIIFSRWSLYVSFLTHSATAPDPSFIQDNALSRFLTSKLESDYETMEAYFMRRSVERAFQLETTETSELGHQISSVVDDVMFILRKVTLRALTTCQSKTLSSIFAVVRRIMEQDFAGIFGRRMQDLQSRIAGPKVGVVRSIEAEKRDRVAYCTLLNNLDMSADYITKIVAEHQASPSLAGFLDRDAAVRVIEVLSTLNERFLRGVEDGIAVLYNSFIKNRIRGLVNDIFIGHTYVLTQTAFEESQSSNTFRAKLSEEWASLITDSFEGVLSPVAYLALLKATIRAFVRVLEKKLLTFKCNELGAIKLDKDISGIIQIACGEYNGVRDRFDRVREFSNVVNWSSDDRPDDGGKTGGGEREGEEIIRVLGLKKVGVEEVEMIRRVVCN